VASALGIDAATLADGARLLSTAAGAIGVTRTALVLTGIAIGGKVLSLGGDATALNRLTAQLPGSFGRYAGGGNIGLSGRLSTIYTARTTVADLVGVASRERVTIAGAVADLNAAAASADLALATPIAEAAVALVKALASACADPVDAFRLLEDLISFVPVGPAAATPIGAALVGLVRRAAGAAIVVAAGDYQPASADDATALTFRVCGLLDSLATEAADAGDDASYKVLRAGRAAVVTDLRNRSASLSRIATFKPGASLPALVLAQRYYRDPSRADQLVRQAKDQVVSPLFMPREYRALVA
jgi:prophage DNA circulation protein